MPNPGSTDSRRLLGAAGEDRAAEWYTARGYAVLDRNWRSSRGRPERAGGELDLIARRGPVVVFAEVKTRSSDRFGEPFEAVTASKQLRIRRLAAQWLRERGPGLGARPVEIRFDVVSVLGKDLEVLEDAF